MKMILDVLVLVGAIGGSTLIAANIGMNVLGYVLFLISSVASLLLLRQSDASKSLVWVNLYFTAMNVIGIVRY
jgi:hypothetical protein